MLFWGAISPFWCPGENGPTKMTQPEDATQGWHEEVAKGTIKKVGVGMSPHPSSPGSAVMDPYPKYHKAKGRTEDACPWQGRCQMWPGSGYQLLLLFLRGWRCPHCCPGGLVCSDPWWLLATLHCPGTTSNSLLSLTGDSGDSFIAPGGLGGVLRLGQIWA